MTSINSKSNIKKYSIYEIIDKKEKLLCKVDMPLDIRNMFLYTYYIRDLPRDEVHKFLCDSLIHGMKVNQNITHMNIKYLSMWWKLGVSPDRYAWYILEVGNEKETHQVYDLLPLSTIDILIEVIKELKS